MKTVWSELAPALSRAVGRLAILAIRLYQLVVSPLLGDNCRFHPTCSQYAIGAIRKYGIARGGIKAVKRVLRCHPWHPGGVDYP